MANSSATTLIGHAWKIMKTDGTTTSTPGLQESMMLAVLNQANMEWQRSFRRSGGEPPTLLERETGFDLVSPTALAEDVTTAETDWDVDSASDLDSSGAFVVMDDGMPDIVEYTSKASNTLSGVSGAAFAHEDGDTVVKLYALPSNFSTFRSEEDNPGGVTVNGTPYTFTSGIPTGTRFSLYDNGTTKYLWLPEGVTGSCRVSYNKTSATIDDSADTVDVPPEYEFFLVHRLVEHGRRVRGDDPGRVVEAKVQADTILLEAQKEKNIGKIARTRPFLGPGRVSYNPESSSFFGI